jgi:hypothetical protein
MATSFCAVLRGNSNIISNTPTDQAARWASASNRNEVSTNPLTAVQTKPNYTLVLTSFRFFLGGGSTLFVLSFDDRG